MEETLDPRRINISKTYSITYAHVGMVKKITDELSARESKNLSEGEIVRRAIDLLFAATFGDALAESLSEPLPEPV